MLKKEVIKILGSVGIKRVEGQLEIPPQKEFGDIAFPCFDLAKKEKKTPNLIAKDIVKKIKMPKGLIEKVEARSGYVNFFFDWKKVAELKLKEIVERETKFGKSEKFKNKIAVVDYSSPNPAHPIHVGSARTTFIGESICRILEAVGYEVKRICYVNDLGKQVATVVWGYLKFAKGEKPTKKPDHWLLDIYVRANEEIAKNPNLEKEVEETLRKCESGDKKTLSVTKKIVNWCVEGFKETYKTIGIEFEEFLHESKFIEISKKYVDKLIKNKSASKLEDGAVISDLESYGLPDTILLRSDGTGLYLTRDVAATIYKMEKYKPDLNIYVVGEDQRLHFQQQFKILEQLGLKDLAKKSIHISYGYVLLPEGKLSSRKGNVILIDDVFEEAVKKIKEKYTKDEKIAKKVGIGAVIYSILKIEPNKQVMFKWEETLKLEGNTGPYLQYAHTRCCGILKKAGEWRPVFKVNKLERQEKELIKHLVSFTGVVEQAAKDLHPHYICNYAFNLATLFNEFYQFCPVLKAETKQRRNFRLSLVKATKIILTNALNLIGIEPLERM